MWQGFHTSPADLILEGGTSVGTTEVWTATPISRGLDASQMLWSAIGVRPHLGEMEAVYGAIEEGQEGHQEPI
jgi:hypothetical protein